MVRFLPHLANICDLGRFKCNKKSNWKWKRRNKTQINNAATNYRPKTAQKYKKCQETVNKSLFPQEILGTGTLNLYY
jgi:hypothetical protein